MMNETQGLCERYPVKRLDLCYNYQYSNVTRVVEYDRQNIMLDYIFNLSWIEPLASFCTKPSDSFDPSPGP